MSSISQLNTRCSVCGAALIFPAGKDEVLCEYCFRPNARPKSETNETTLMKYANERRNIGEFEEAAATYRQVLQKNIHEHEARWGLLMCKYGVMYVEDKASGQRVITCRRAVNSSIQAEPDYRKCCEEAGEAVRAAYEKDAAYIDAVQKEIRRIRASEAPYDIFICYKESAPEGGRTRDSVFAQQICSRMTDRGFRVFYAPVSLKQKSGANYEAAIFAALSDARVMLSLGTRKEYFESTWVRSEWKRFLEMIDAGEDKLLIPMYRDLDPGADLPSEFRMRYLQGLNMADVGFLYDLESLLDKVIRKGGGSDSPKDKPAFDRRELIHALFMVEEGSFDAARTALAAVIKVLPECAEAHIGMCMAKAGIRFEEELPGVKSPLRKNPDFRRALRFASEKDRKRLQGYVEAQEARFTREEAERQKAKDEGETLTGAGTTSGGAETRQQSETSTVGEEEIAQLTRRAREKDVDAQMRLATMLDRGEGVEMDRRQALAWYRLAAKQGNAEAQYRLGELYFGGDGVNQDRNAAVSWFRQAANQGFAPACHRLGVMYENGEGVARDKLSALQFYRQAANQGHPAACWSLGRLYESGDGVARDRQRAMQLYRQAAEGGCADAQYRLGHDSHVGDGVLKDMTEAVHWYRLAAEQGHPAAQYALGALYSAGEGVPTDPAQAVSLYRLAAEQGLAEAQDALGTLTYNGEGVARDFAEAARWFGLAAEQGLSMAQYHLGCMYYAGEGLARDVHMALKCFRLAANQGSLPAKCRIGDIYYNGDGVPENRAEAAKWYRLAATPGYAPAQFNLGTLYYTGSGVLRDKVGAARLYRQAAKQGHLQAQRVLADMLYNGDGVPAKREEALKWYLAAANQGDAGAQYTLGSMLRRGEGMRANLSEARRWLLTAAKQGLPEAQYAVGIMYFKGEGTEADREAARTWLIEAEKQGSNEARAFLRDHFDPAESRTEAVPQQPPAASEGTADTQAADSHEIRDDWPRIIAAVRDGSARKRYAVGDWKALDLSGSGRVRMVLVGFELDDSAKGGKAPTTWVALDCLNAPRPMNPALPSPNPPFKKGTGAIGGWQGSGMKRYLSDTVLPELPEALRGALLPVLKSHDAFNASGYYMRQKTMDALWIPGADEVLGDGARYANLNGIGQTPAWLRTAADLGSFMAVEGGAARPRGAECALGVIIGFCL